MKNRIKLTDFVIALTVALAVGTALPADTSAPAPASRVVAGDAGWQSPTPRLSEVVLSDAGWQ
ncbi:hypothetical protein ABT403_38145 [Streptomyces sp. NPDC000075]